jgi:hypothetical protein
MKEVFVVIAYRMGEREKHSYTVSAFSTEKSAIKCAESHCTYRGGKYACAVERLILDSFSNELLEYTTEVYRAKSNSEA